MSQEARKVPTMPGYAGVAHLNGTYCAKPFERAIGACRARRAGGDKRVPI